MLKMEKDILVVGEFKFNNAEIENVRASQKGFFAGCCGLAMTEHSGMYNIATVRQAMLIRVAAWKTRKRDPKVPYQYGDDYNSGYVLCSTDKFQTARMSEQLVEAGFKAFDTFINPAHGSGNTITVWGAATIPWIVEPEVAPIVVSGANPVLR